MEFNNSGKLNERKASIVTETSGRSVGSFNEDVNMYEKTDSSVVGTQTVAVRHKSKVRVSMDETHQGHRELGRFFGSRLSHRRSCSLPDILDIDNIGHEPDTDSLNKTGDSSDLDQSFEEHEERTEHVTQKLRNDSLTSVQVCGKAHFAEPSFICLKDNEIYCSVCVHVHNHHCNEQVKFIPEIPPELRQKYCEDAVIQLQVIRCRFLKIQQQNQNLQTQLKTSKKDFVRSVMKFKNSIIASVDHVEKKALCQMDEMYSAEMTNLEKNMHKLDTKISNLESFLKLLDGYEYSEQNSVVLEAQQALSQVRTDERCVRDCHKASVEIGISFEVLPKLTDLMAEIDEYWKVSRKESELCRFPLPCLCDKPYSNKKAVKEKEISVRLAGWSFDREHCCITGCEFMENGKMLICDNANKKVKLFSKKFKCLSAQALHALPWDIAVINNEQAVVTIPDKKQLQFLGIVNRKICLKHEKILDQNCWGVSSDAESIYVTCWSREASEIIIMNHWGSSQRRLAIGTFHTPWFVDRFADRLYVSDWGTYNVHCLTDHTAHSSSYRNSYLVGPLGVTHDPEGNVYVCGRDSNTVHQISRDGELRQIILREKDGVKQPLNICHRPADDKLVVTSWMCDKITIYKLI